MDTLSGRHTDTNYQPDRAVGGERLSQPVPGYKRVRLVEYDTFAGDAIAELRLQTSLLIPDGFLKLTRLR